MMNNEPKCTAWSCLIKLGKTSYKYLDDDWLVPVYSKTREFIVRSTRQSTGVNKYGIGRLFTSSLMALGDEKADV